MFAGSNESGASPKTVQISEPFEGLTRLCRPSCDAESLRLSGRIRPALPSALAGRLSPPASAEEVGRGPPPRKGEAFPHIRRRSRESPPVGSSAIWTSPGTIPPCGMLVVR